MEKNSDLGQVVGIDLERDGGRWRTQQALGGENLDDLVVLEGEWSLNKS